MVTTAPKTLLEYDLGNYDLNITFETMKVNLTLETNSFQSLNYLCVCNHGNCKSEEMI